MAETNTFKIIWAFLAGAILTAAAARFLLPPHALSAEQQKMFVAYVLQNSSEWRKTKEPGKTLQGVAARQAVFAIEDKKFNPDFLLASPGSELIAYKQGIGVLLILRPALTDSVVTWRCFGFPMTAIPTSC